MMKSESDKARKDPNSGKELGTCMSCGGSMGFYRTGDKIALVCDNDARHMGMVPLENYPINGYTHGHKWSKVFAAVIMTVIIGAILAVIVRIALIFYGV